MFSFESEAFRFSIFELRFYDGFSKLLQLEGGAVLYKRWIEEIQVGNHEWTRKGEAFSILALAAAGVGGGLNISSLVSGAVGCTGEEGAERYPHQYRHLPGRLSELLWLPPATHS